MAHHQQLNHDRMLALPALSSASATRASPQTLTNEEDNVADLDEPPDAPMMFSKKTTHDAGSPLSDIGPILSPHYRKASLLTQALLTSPEFGAISDTEAPHLTSDGGLTSPTRTTTPSPPLPATKYSNLPSLGSKELLFPIPDQNSVSPQVSEALGIDRTQETKVEETLGRRRCISFACGKQAPSQNKSDSESKPQEAPKHNASPPTAPLRRPCMLKFACPMKPSRTGTREPTKFRNASETRENSLSSTSAQGTQTNLPPKHKLDAHVITSTATKLMDSSAASIRYNEHETPKHFNRINYQKSEATSFHEFAGSYLTEDEWTNEQTAYRKKMTITDTLQKENAIRQLAEEAEEEALEEDVELDKDREGDNGDDDDFDNADDLSDDGNETDDEEGFAESDDDSEAGYQFWTPGCTTAATSTDQVEHIRPIQQRVASDSSIESVVKAKCSSTHTSIIPEERKQRLRAPTTTLNQPEEPSKPEGFIIGTLDEDRPLEDAYLSSVEHRKRSKYKLIPQDIDPSFPTSDPDAQDDGNDSEEWPEVENARENEAQWITGRPDSSEDEQPRCRKKASEKRRKTSVPSPKRMHSPPPRRLFGQSTHRLRSPPPLHRKLASPPSSRRPSLTGSPSVKLRGISMPHLAQRPNLTHTTSLPRTPNPFWDLHGKGRVREPETPLDGTSSKPSHKVPMDFHGRGPIDIVQGLENKRQRRKEKFWRIHCQKAHAGKEKERKCQPGKGAERMREVGKEMQDRFKGYGHRPNLMLSV